MADKVNEAKLVEVIFTRLCERKLVHRSSSTTANHGNQISSTYIRSGVSHDSNTSLPDVNSSVKS